MKVYLIYCFLLTFAVLSSCKMLPKQKLRQFHQDADVTVENDSLYLSLTNSLKCPFQLNIHSKIDSMESLFNQHFPVVMAPLTDTVFVYPTSYTKKELGLSISGTFGNPTDSLLPKPISMPFPKGKSYKIIQGYNGNFSHQSSFSRYAIDFSLAIGDTICAAADGVVIGVIKGYTYGGKSRKWRDYANFITLYHPEMRLYTQYVHLLHEGSFVAVGDSVKEGQAIGLAGMTGFTSVEHLHFNVLKATDEAMISTPIEFKGGIPGKELKRGTIVKR